MSIKSFSKYFEELSPDAYDKIKDAGLQRNDPRGNRIADTADQALNEALNKDIKSFGQDLDNRLKKAGFQTKILIGQSNDEFRKIVRSKTGLVLIEVSETPTLQMMFVFVNPSEYEKAKKVIDKFQFIPYNGQKMQKGWTTKQVEGALNPGDIYKQEDKNDGRFDFMRLAKIDTKIRNK